MAKEKRQENVILRLCFEFSLAVIEYCEKLENEKKYVISRQLLKSATSIGANAFEAQNAESRADFIHKFKVAAKEVEETSYWLMLCNYSKSYPNCQHLLIKLKDISNVIGKIISSSRGKQ